jgi:hypothetical protein
VVSAGCRRLVETGSILDAVAKAHNATPKPDRACLGLKRSPVMLPIPARLRSRTWKKTSQPSTLSYRMKSSTAWTAKDERNTDRPEVP